MLTITPNSHSKDDPKFLEILTAAGAGAGAFSWTHAELSPFMEYQLTITETDSSNITGFELHIRGEFMPGTVYSTEIVREQP